MITRELIVSLTRKSQNRAFIIVRDLRSKQYLTHWLYPNQLTNFLENNNKEELAEIADHYFTEFTGVWAGKLANGLRPLQIALTVNK